MIFLFNSQAIQTLGKEQQWSKALAMPNPDIGDLNLDIDIVDLDLNFDFGDLDIDIKDVDLDIDFWDLHLTLGILIILTD